MKWRLGVEPPLWIGLVTVGVLLLGAAETDAAYRLVLRNGTSVEVPSYENLGDAIRYPRLGGTVVVRKSDLSGIETAVHAPPPTPPPAGPIGVVPVVPISPPVKFEKLPVPVWQPAPAAPQSVPVLALPWKRLDDTGFASGAILALTGVALVFAAFAVVLFLSGGTVSIGKGEKEEDVAVQWSPGEPEEGRAVPANAARPLGVALVGIYDVLAGATDLLAGLAGAAAGQVLAQFPVFQLRADGPIALIGLSIAAAVLGAITLATAYGMWSLQPWGRRLQVIVCFTGIGLDVLSFLARPGSAVSLLSVASLIIASAILLYIRRPSIQALYGSDVHELEDPLEPMPDDEPHTPSLFDEEVERDAQPR